MEDFWRKRGGAGAYEADIGDGGWMWRFEQDLMNCGNCRVPVRGVGSEVVPEC